MSKNKIKKLKRLAEKLRRVRLKLGLSQAKMAEALGQYCMKKHPSSIRAYENGNRLPPPMVALAYGKLAKFRSICSSTTNETCLKVFRVRVKRFRAQASACLCLGSKTN
jgi:DNA-binding XRE family transcriptional regulator